MPNSSLLLTRGEAAIYKENLSLRGLGTQAGSTQYPHRLAKQITDASAQIGFIREIIHYAF